MLFPKQIVARVWAEALYGFFEIDPIAINVVTGNVIVENLSDGLRAGALVGRLVEDDAACVE
jgi:uncharacterized membrane protein